MADTPSAPPARNVKRWQHFLKTHGLDPGSADGVWGARTAGATADFQKRAGLPATGSLDRNTRQAAQDSGFEPTFTIGPYLDNDLRERRPYFLIPLLCLDPHSAPQDVRARLKGALAGQRFSDIYVLSHGWHRNFYSAVAAYDRLVSRFSVLRRRGRLVPPHTDDYRPLFLALHWHSDPGEDQWVDAAGRRHKAGFLQNIQAAFTAKLGANVTDADFLNDWENIFAFLTAVSAPGVPALSSQMDKLAQDLLNTLDERYELKGGPGADAGEKAAMAWACFNEAPPQRVLTDQGERPRSYNGLGNALVSLFKFLGATLGLGTVLAYLFGGRFTLHVGHPPVLWDLWLGRWFIGLRGISAVARQPPTVLVSTWLLLSLMVLGITALWNQRHRKGRASQGLPLAALLGWLPLQAVCAAPLVVWAFLTYLLGGPVASFWTRHWGTFPFVFDERYRIGRPRKHNGRDLLAGLARGPLWLLKKAVGADSQVMAVADTLDGQFAFWEMQRKGADAGREAGDFLADLITDVEGLHGARIHAIGHSFGGLLLANAMHRLAARRVEDAAVRQSVVLQTLCLVQGALGADWFDGEETLRQAIQGNITCIYSAYDTANGFYYPFSNNGRMAAGFVGLTRVGKGYPTPSLGKDGLFASLVLPPHLDDALDRALAPGGPDAAYGWHKAVNLDGSRVIYEGPAAAGGGHDDIFKDDVVHLLWASAALERPETPV